MKNNLDEDSLKRLNLIIEKTKAYDDCVFPVGTYGEFGSLYISDLKKALSELEKYKRLAEANLKDSEEFEKNMCEHRCPMKSHYEEELETQINNTHILQSQLDVANAEKIEWKKIAEMLAYELCECDFEYHCEHCRTDICSAYENNDEYMQCIIDWARKEVENEKNNSNT